MMLALSAVVPIAVGAVVVVLVLVVLVWRRRHSGDPVKAFQRHIDALSPEARRPVVDRVQQIEQEERRGNGEAGGDASGK